MIERKGRYLNDESFIDKSRGQANATHVSRFVDEILNAMENAL